MVEEFLGRGWTFPLQVDDEGHISMSEYETDIKEAIWIILSTAKGERVMRPDFGCGIHDFVFSVINTSTLTLIENSIKEALTIWEPRIDLANVNVSTEKISEGKLIIDIEYIVRSTNNRFNMVYPFYLREGK
ncbi:MAG: baseplate protein [Candidatus Aminicenantes bacterium]|nr:baseplate protein [Candidatus Aminicenantes bacterium]NIM81872.1 baseplate protein [Candidatus Aminicenantes bacterium]NIN21249.1 baseplate protein [Candidatus Aminicenantes bacterium]NIN45070.1 baseplate protein [Candidatus Aminicenantes bacterium]NIN87887.1 baseplate protein [Candidatus Aminicenantes bacterium]